jgi:predicted transcriptional regulator
LDPIIDKVAKLLETIPAYEADAIQWAAALSKRGVLTNLVSHQNKLENRLTSVKDDPADVVVTRIKSIVVQYALHTTSVVAADAADLKQLRATVNSVGDLSCPEALLNAAHEKIVELEGKFGRGKKRKAVGEGVDATTAKGVTIAKAAKK